MSLLSSFWDGFLETLTINQKEVPVLYSVLKHVKPIELTNETIVVGCENLGSKIFLEKRTNEIEKQLSFHIKKRVKITFVIIESKKKEKEAPLLSFQPSQEDIFLKSGLHSKYSFDNFAVSSTNQVAYAASQAVSNNPGTAYNPLFLYGGVGVGKTHLAQSIARKILENDRGKKVYFCPSDHFTNELVEAIRDRSTPRFRRKYRFLSVLILDDIQFIAGKQHIQEEFFHTFNSVVSSGGQIILASDRPPSEIRDIEDRLRSRFSGGLIVDIQPPDFELRCAIVLIKAQEKKIEIEMDAAKIIAEQITDSRALEGSLLSIYAKTLGIKEKIDLDSVEGFFSEKTKAKVQKITAADVIKSVSSYYNIPQSHLKGELRTDLIALPRQIAMFLLRKELKIKYEEVAFLLRRKDHTTVIHAVDKINRLIAKDSVFRQDIENITKSIFSST
ncbi:chromosomal replication initiator protein DnaA [Candidatus Roizmanbacteria bacterium]|nr:chromosomal replication initiator protein DnaA [Candidatus Roizmanbacteria bacterium]